jgi:hypothetical protein
MSELDMERWEEIGEQARRVQAELYHLQRMMGDDVPKSVYMEAFGDADTAVVELKSALEDRMAQEHPESWDTGTFFGDEPTPERED